jgi:hypothetical protein
MNGLRITCTSCGRSWPLLVAPSAYLELFLEAQPCPACEDAAVTFGRLIRPRLLSQKSAQSL